MPIVESNVRGFAARSATVGSSRRSRDERGARLALARGRHRSILWANAVGAAIFSVEPAALQHAPIRFQTSGGAGNRRLAETLPPSPQARLERLRGFGGSFGRAVTCSCWRVAAEAGAAIFVVAAEPVGPALALRERVSGLFADTGKPLLAFTPDGKLLYATAPAQARFAAITSAAALGAALFDHALSAGSASGATPHGRVTIERLGTDASAVLIAEFEAERSGTLVGEGALRTRMRVRLCRRRCRARLSRRALRRFAAATNPRRTGGIRCALSGRWTPRAISLSARTNSWNSWARGPRPLSAGYGARSRPTSNSIPTARSRVRWQHARPGAASRCCGLWTTAANACRSSCQGFRCSIATGSFVATAGSVCAATSIASINWPGSRRERPIGFHGAAAAAGAKADAIADEAERAIAPEPMPAARQGDATGKRAAGQHARRSRQRASRTPGSPRARCGAGCGERRAISHKRTVRDESAGAQPGRAQGISRIGGGTDGAVAGRARRFDRAGPGRWAGRR